MNGEKEHHYHISHPYAHIISIFQTKGVAFLRFSISLFLCRKKPQGNGRAPLYKNALLPL